MESDYEQRSFHPHACKLLADDYRAIKSTSLQKHASNAENSHFATREKWATEPRSRCRCSSCPNSRSSTGARRHIEPTDAPVRPPWDRRSARFLSLDGFCSYIDHTILPREGQSHIGVPQIGGHMNKTIMMHQQR